MAGIKRVRALPSMSNKLDASLKKKKKKNKFFIIYISNVLDM